MTGPVQKPDETIPGGRYLNAAQDRWIDCWGADLGPVTCTDCDCPDGECAPAPVVGEAKPKRTRKAA